jgi:formate dehydrogenase accessory protein FdhD
MPSIREAASVEVAVERWQSGRIERLTDSVAEEAPVALVYHGVPHVVMLATPADLEDYAIGFTVSEGLVANAGEIQSVEIVPAAAAASAASAASNAVPANAIEVRIGIAQHRFSALLQRRRNLTGRTGCGLCGTETLEQAMRPIAPVAAALKVSAGELHRALESLGAMQPVNSRTGSVHAAAWVLPGQGIQFVREDVGRHNALDKAIGALIRSGQDVSRGYMVITSRASYEMVQKSAAVGVGLLAAVSAPTALAIRTAEQAGITLIGFARADRHVVYCHPHRLV